MTFFRYILIDSCLNFWLVLVWKGLLFCMGSFIRVLFQSPLSCVIVVDFSFDLSCRPFFIKCMIYHAESCSFNMHSMFWERIVLGDLRLISLTFFPFLTLHTLYMICHAQSCSRVPLEQFNPREFNLHIYVWEEHILGKLTLFPFLDLLQKLCENRSYEFLRLDGKTPTNKRQSLVDRFNDKYCKVCKCFNNNKNHWTSYSYGTKSCTHSNLKPPANGTQFISLVPH